MAKNVVKIHELPNDSWENLNEKEDLLLKSKIVDSTRNPQDILDAAFVSKATNFEQFIQYILTNPQHITNQWKFISGRYPPLMLTLFDIAKNSSFFHTWFEDANKLRAMNSNSAPYSNNGTFFQNGVQTQMVDSCNANKCSVANLDYTNRLIGLVYESLRDSIYTIIRALLDVNSEKHYVPSFVGQIVHATDTLLPNKNNLNDDSAPRSVFGDGSVFLTIAGYEFRKPDTHWRLHILPYSFRCSNSNVLQINATNGTNATGGDNSDRSFDLPQHHHNVPSHDHGSRTISSSKSVSSFLKSTDATADMSEIKDGDVMQIGTDYDIIVHPDGTTERIPKPIYEDNHVPYEATEGPDIFNKSTPTGNSGSGSVSGGLTINKTTASESVKSPTVNIESAYKYCYMWERVS